MINIEEKLYNKLSYLECVPSNFESDKKYPVILHLHGAGSIGTDIKVLYNQPIVKYAQSADGFPFVMFLPQCNVRYWEFRFEQLQEFIHYIKELPFVDTDKIFISGISMGAIASWNILAAENTTFKKAVICCGAGFVFRAKAVNASVWAFHGDTDTSVPYPEGKKMIDEMQKLGKSARLTTFDGVGHNVWDTVYNDPDVYEWLLS